MDFTYTVGTYSPGKLSVVYEINIHVFPTVPSPTTTHLIGRPEDIMSVKLIKFYLKHFWYSPFLGVRLLFVLVK